MELTTRCYSEEVRQIIIDGIKRTAKGIAICRRRPGRPHAHRHGS